MKPSRFVLALIVLGAGIRLAAYLSDPSLWGDEGMVLYNLLRPPFDVMRETNFAQVLPIGFLIPQAAIVQLFGQDELALRALPLIASLAALPAFWWLARRILSERASFLALALFAVAPYSVVYAAVAKHYAVTVLVAILLSLLALRAAEPDLDRREGWKIGAAGFALAWFTETSVFLLSGLGLAIFIARRRYGKPDLPEIALLSSWALAMLLVGAQSALSGGVGFMRWYWADLFLPPPISAEALATWGVGAMTLFEHPGGFAVPILAVALFAIGLKRPKVGFLIAPLLPVVIASMLGLYPFGALWDFPAGRLLIFLLPAVLIGTAAGVELLSERWRYSWLVALPLLVMSTSTAVQDVQWLHAQDVSRSFEHSPLVLEYFLLPTFRYHTGQRVYQPENPPIPIESLDESMWQLYFDGQYRLVYADTLPENTMVRP